MSYDDPEFLECTCHNRALRENEKVIYYIPRLVNGVAAFEKMVFAKDCPIHGYSVNHVEENPEKGK